MSSGRAALHRIRRSVTGRRPGPSATATDAARGASAAPIPAPDPVGDPVEPIPRAPAPKQRPGRLLDLGEEAGSHRFFTHYAEVMGLEGPPGSWGAESQLDPVDWGEVLVPSHLGTERDGPIRVDVVIAVRGSIPSVRTTLWALLGKTGRPFHLVLVDSSRSAEVSRFLHEFVDRHPYAALVANPDPSGRRWKGENAGALAAGGDLVVFLEAGAVVSHGWLDGLVDCVEADPTCGVAGPLADDAVGLQSFPHPAGAGAANELPAWLTPDGVALFLRGGSPKRPEVDVLDRCCRAVRREVLDAVGAFGGDDDFGERVRAAGWSLRVADDSYLRRARDGSPAEPMPLVDDPLQEARALVGAALESPAAVAGALRTARPRSLTVGFVMPNMAHGGSGGLHSVYQEASGLRELGVDTKVFANRTYLEHARVAYEDADEVFVEFATDDDVERLSRDRQVLVATHFKSVRSVVAVWARRQDFLPVYYVQDYEPFFTVNVNGGAPESLEARSSYDAIPGMLLFAKTHWICNAVGQVRGLPVAKIEPGIDERLFTATHGCLRPSGPVRVLGMVRPRTWRRQPFATLMLLDRLQTELGDAVEVSCFGCTDDALALMAAGQPHAVVNHGVLTRREIADRLHETDVFLDVSAFQGMGRTGFEGMCCGCTPIMPRIGGAHEFAVHDECAVLVDSSDLESCYRDLRDLVLDRERIARLQDAGVRAGQRRSVLAAVLSEYAIIDHEHGRRFGHLPADHDPDGAAVRPGGTVVRR